MTAVAAGERPRIEALDGLRGVAILLVVLLHTGGPPPGVFVQPTDWDFAYAHVAAFGWAGVDLFFVLSGFLITGILVRGKDTPHYFRNFYARRTLRIFPLYYVVVVACLFVWPQKVYGASETTSYLTYWSNFWQAAHPEVARTDKVIGLAWSLAIEEQFYLVWPMVVYLLSPRALLRACVAIVLAAPLLRGWLLHAGFDWWTPYVATPCRIDALAFGALVAVLPPLDRRLLWGGVAVAASGLALVIGVQGFAAAYGTWMQTAGYSCNALLAACVVGLAMQPGWVAWFGTVRWLQWFGRYSYAIYLLHGALIHGLQPLCFGPQAWLPLGDWIVHTGSYLPGVFVFFVLAAVVSLGAAFVSWHLFEKHLLALKRFFP